MSSVSFFCHSFFAFSTCESTSALLIPVGTSTGFGATLAATTGVGVGFYYWDVAASFSYLTI